MRLKVLFSAAGLAICVLSAAIALRNSQSRTVTGAIVDSSTSASPGPEADSRPIASSPKVYAYHRDENAVTDDGANADASTVAHRDYVAEKKSELVQLATQDDAGSVGAIVSQMTSPDPEIRKAALEAIEQSNNPDAIPALQNQLLYANDPQEKVDIQTAIDYLKLPSQ